MTQGMTRLLMDASVVIEKKISQLFRCALRGTDYIPFDLAKVPVSPRNSPSCAA
jgi:hypothetical protein